MKTTKQIQIMRVFDELIQNRDRNQGNILWTNDWTMWLIDHTRAFRLGKELLKPEQPDALRSGPARPPACADAGVAGTGRRQLADAS